MKKNKPVKSRLIETASELFYQNGYNNTGINEVIEKANVAKASLYMHFKTKDALCLAYLNHKEEQFYNKLSVFLNSKQKGKVRVLALYDFLRELFRDSNFKGSWNHNILAELPKNNTIIKEEIFKNKTVLRKFITDLVKTNLEVKQPEKLASKLYLLFEGALVESFLQQDSWPIKEAKEIALILI
ncbi:MAG: TetR/AcrR family transcriptional regulator [Flavobacteriaceae bacterium]|nr:TetR/AcrR family transcriptional regulator [Flavobacteriaceae bacterium]